MLRNAGRHVVILGAGMGGSLMAIYLARGGFHVDVFERRDDLRRVGLNGGRSINMTLAARGLHALDEVGLQDTVMAMTVPLLGRMIHSENGVTCFQRYGRDDSEAHHSIKRSQLNAVLMNCAQSFDNVRLFFNQRCVALNKDTGKIRLRDERSGRTYCVNGDFIIGADGAYSCVRDELQRGQVGDFDQQYLPEGYTELTIPARHDGTYVLDPHALHVWPRGKTVLIAIPNNDGSFTCTLTVPFSTREAVCTLASARDYFSAVFPEVLELAPHVPQEFVQSPLGKYLTIKTAPWYYRDRVVLIGDACHSVLPFYGQGMNAAFEDCGVLFRSIDANRSDTEEAFAEYQELRKKNTDALADLSVQNYTELRRDIRSPLFVARKKVDLLLNRCFPNAFVPLYSLISHTTTPYAQAVERCSKQDRILRSFGLTPLLWVIATPIALAQWIRIFKAKVFSVAELCICNLASKVKRTRVAPAPDEEAAQSEPAA